MEVKSAKFPITIPRYSGTFFIKFINYEKFPLHKMKKMCYNMQGISAGFSQILFQGSPEGINIWRKPQSIYI